MEERLMRNAALYQLIKLVDENNGSLNIGTEKVKRVFCDEDDIVRIEYVNGEVQLLADSDFKTMNESILKWQNDNP